ncbi:hypothetical protein HMI54_002499, partial [Coelomomyces lativittatus]
WATGFSRAFVTESLSRQPSTLVLVEHHEGTVLPGTFHALAAAKKLNQPISFFVCTDKEDGFSSKGVEELQKYQPKAIMVTHHPTFKQSPPPELLASSLVQVLKENPFSHCIASHTTFAKNVLPRAAALLGVSPISDVVLVHDPSTFTRPIYAGNALSKVHSKQPLQLLTVRTTAFPKPDPSSSTAASTTTAPVVNLPPPSQSVLSEFVSETKAKSDRPELQSAQIVVSGGRGLKSAENFKLLYTLADKLNAAVGASRAAVDAGYADNSLQIGQTGKVVAPALYIGVGVSGAIQHLAGMKDAKVICAINNDADAPIFQVADYGLVADLFQAVPELTKKL